MTIHTEIVRTAMAALEVVIEDIGGLGRGERDYIDGPRAAVVPPNEAFARLAACLDLLPSALLDPSGPSEWELDFAAHEIREAALIFAAPSRYVRIAKQLEALAYRAWEVRAQGARTFVELTEKRPPRSVEAEPAAQKGLAGGDASGMPAEWQELIEHLRHSPDFSNFKPSQEINHHHA